MLPAEVRLKIWSFSFPGPRVLEIVWNGNVWAYIPESRPAPNFAGFANREANSLFEEKWYRLKLLQWSGFLKYRPGQTVSYFNPEIDTLYISATTIGQVSLPPKAIDALTAMSITHSLRFVAFEIGEWYKTNLPNSGELEFLTHFPKLESFIIAGYDINWSWLTRRIKRPKGEIQFVSPAQLDIRHTLEVAPNMLKRLADVWKSYPEASIPHATAKEVLRGGVRMQYT
jgi:hypothetical protein